MSVPFVLSAQALLLPAPGGLSLLHGAGESKNDDLRKFMAAPANIKTAVDALKKAGFKIISVGRTSVGILAATSLFEKIFTVVVTRDETTKLLSVKNAGVAGVIPPGNFAGGLLEGIVISQENEVTTGTAPPKKDTDAICKYWPEDIPLLLGFATMDEFNIVKQTLAAYLKDATQTIKLHVLDSGFHPHGYLQDKFPDAIARVGVFIDKQVAAEKIRETKLQIEALAELDDTLNIFLRQYFNAHSKDPNSLNGYKDDDDFLLVLHTIEPAALQEEIRALADFNAYEDFVQKILPDRITLLELTLDEFHIFFTTAEDTGSHGTQVIANALPVIDLLPVSHYKIEVYKTMPEIKRNNFFKAFQNKKHEANEIQIINCSYGSALTEDGAISTDDISINMDLAFSSDTATIIFSAGNADKLLLTRKPFETRNRKVITVGGAYTDEHNEITASMLGHGYITTYDGEDRKVPDICGILGPPRPDNKQFAGGIVWTPTFKDKSDADQSNDGWSSNGGTSLAAPQVAALCAVLKMISPDLTTDDLKKVLLESSGKVNKGFFFDPAKPAEGTAAATIGTGLINIKNAIIAALVLRSKKMTAVVSATTK